MVCLQMWVWVNTLIMSMTALIATSLIPQQSLQSHHDDIDCDGQASLRHEQGCQIQTNIQLLFKVLF